jgi:hypothetical protein
MRAFLLLLLVSAPRERLFAPRQTHANCRLVRMTPPSLQDIAVARSAVRAFAHQIGSPYTALYLQATVDKRKPPTCVLVVQHSAKHFTRYTYQAQRVDSSQVVVSTWQPLLAQLGKGYYATECESISTAPTMSMLLVKQGPKLTYSLQFTDYYAPDFTAADRARMASALALVQRLIK